jgi:hypothetical protein
MTSQMVISRQKTACHESSTGRRRLGAAVAAAIRDRAGPDRPEEG